MPKLRVGVQARYFLLGNFGNAITLDWANADYKVNEKFGVRFGKVKIPSGLFNEIQDIDPSYMWALLPQSVYTLPDRNSISPNTAVWFTAQSNSGKPGQNGVSGLGRRAAHSKRRRLLDRLARSRNEPY